MSVFSTLLYASTREIPTLLYTSSLKRVPLLGAASPYSPLLGVPPRAWNTNICTGSGRL